MPMIAGVRGVVAAQRYQNNLFSIKERRLSAGSGVPF
jgi:hypothetical protein